MKNAERQILSVKIIRKEDGRFAVRDAGVLHLTDPTNYQRTQGSFTTIEDAEVFARNLSYPDKLPVIRDF